MPMPDGTPTDDELNREAISRQDISQHPRMLAMAAIADAHEADIARDHEAEGLQVDGATPNPAPATPQPTPTPAPTAAPAHVPSAIDKQLLEQFGDEPVPMEALDSVKVKVKVDGQERVMTVHDLRRGVQLDGAAHARLEEANRILREAQARTTQQPPVGVAPPAASSDSSATSKDATEKAKSLVQALFEGDETKAAALMDQVLASRQTPQPIDPATVTAQVVSSVRQQLSMDEANAQFRSDFPDVVGDPLIAGVADQFFAEATALDPQKSYAQALSEAGTKTREWLASKGVRSATEPARGSTRQEKLDAKQRMDGKEVRGLNRTETKQEPQVETVQDVIAQMRAARGLA